VGIRIGVKDAKTIRMTIIKQAWLTAIITVLSGCAGYTPRVNVADVPTLQDAYIYGRFHIDAPRALLGMDGHQTMGFAIKCDDGQSYVLRFDRENPVLAIKIKPAICSWSEIVYSDADGAVRLRKPAPAEAFKAVVFQGGYSYYVGDFHAAVSNSVSGNMARTEWKIKAIRENYEITTQDMLEVYPNLRSLPTENRMLTSTQAPHSIPKPKGVGGFIALALP
jgi:hypothetical protein